MKKTTFLLLSLAFLLFACKSHQKKILIYANSDIQVDESQKNITVQEGNTQIERELDYSSSDEVTLNITGPQGHYTLVANEDGYWLANLKADTVLGSMQHIGTTAQTRITQEQLKKQLDSLNLLVKGANISVEAKNYFVLPGKIVKISGNTNVKIFGPFTSIPHDFDAGSVSEVYKFYNLSEEEKIIHKMTDMGTYKGE